MMAWLSLAAKSLAHSGKLVSWTTPLGLPVVQPYRKLVRTLAPPSLPPFPQQGSFSPYPDLLHSCYLSCSRMADLRGYNDCLSLPTVKPLYLCHASPFHCSPRSAYLLTSLITYWQLVELAFDRLVQVVEDASVRFFSIPQGGIIL